MSIPNYFSFWAGTCGLVGRARRAGERQWKTGQVYDARYMSFAPRLQSWVLEALPDIGHIDGTARVQTLEKAEEPWLYELLVELKVRTGEAADQLRGLLQAEKSYRTELLLGVC